MELVGLNRCLATLAAHGKHVTDITTDRHVQVKKKFKELRLKAIERGEVPINHWFDTWHVAKGVYRKLLVISKRRTCAVIARWAHSVSNHLYWAASSSKGVSQMVLDRWLSVANHICDIHENHTANFPQCLHGPIQREWLQKGSKPYKEFIKIIESPFLLRDIGQLSPLEQTSQLESYHKVVCDFAPKFLNYGYPAMKARLLLAAIHTNENAERKQAMTQDGELKWRIKHPKWQPPGSDGVACPVKEPCTYGYINDLLREVHTLRDEFPTYELALAANRSQVPPTLASRSSGATKQELIDKHVSRFATDHT